VVPVPALLRRFGRDERGIAMVFVAIMLPILVGFALLAIDMSRANSLHNDLQKGADAFALAGAAELDGSTGAQFRARAAITNLIANQAKFSTTDDDHTLTIGDVDIAFLSGLPSDDLAIDKDGVDANGKDWATDEDGSSRFIEVTVKPNVGVAGFAAIFPASFLGEGPDSFTIGAQAVAGFKQSICDVTPMFICNPFETDGLDFADAFAAGETYSRLFSALKVDSAPGAGNFGLLDFDNSISVQEAFAKGSGGQCYQQTAVTTKTGVTLVQVNTGLNVRFDLYSGSAKKHNAEFDWRPSINVRKGAGNGSNCNKFNADDSTPLKAMGFPAGSAGTYPDQAGVTGEVWDRSGYWTLNHGTTLPTIASVSNPVSSAAPPSRYDVYRYEIDHDLVGDKAGGKNNGETGTPACYTGPSTDITEDPDRRVIVAAIVNCSADAAKITGKTTLRPDTYASIFLTNPVQKTDPTADDDTNASEKPINFEVVDVTGPKGNGTLDNFLHDEAQLYR
jgi:Flp pilus assembly protein TadG